MQVVTKKINSDKKLTNVVIDISLWYYLLWNHDTTNIKLLMVNSETRVLMKPVNFHKNIQVMSFTVLIHAHGLRISTHTEISRIILE